MCDRLKCNTEQIERSIDSTLVVTLRILVAVFFVIVAAASFVFAIALTSVCVAATVLHLMVKFVARRPETHRLFALAGC